MLQIEYKDSSSNGKVGELTERIQELKAERSTSTPGASMQCGNVLNHQQVISDLQEV